MRVSTLSPALLLALLFSLILGGFARAEESAPVPAPLGNVVNDYAKLLTEEEITALTAIGDELWSEKRVPLAIITIEQMADYPDLPATTITEFTDTWLAGWALGDPMEPGRSVVLFVSKTDREARLVLGEAFTLEFQVPIKQLMADNLVPHFRNDEWGLGILATTEALKTLVMTSEDETVDDTPAPVSG